jgi:hypothetical protein
MNSPDPAAPEPLVQDEDQPSKGPNLTLIFSLLGLALVIAIALAAFIVLPFYQRH